MKLIDLIKDIENVDQDYIIFQEYRDNPNSNIILSYAEEGDRGIKEHAGRKYYYLIEVFLAKEFVDDWKASLNYNPSFEETVKRLYDYAINDA